MFDPLPPPITKDNRDIAWEVALAYRRTSRAAKAAGASPPECEEAAVDAAMRKYREFDPDAPSNCHDASGVVLAMVGDAILADTYWFWHGPDA